MADVSFTLDLKFIITAIVLPVATWIIRGAYDSWRLRGLYLSAIPGTGEAPSLAYEDADKISAVHFGIDIRVLNLTEKFLAVQWVKIRWDRVKSQHIPDLRWLRDDEPLVASLDQHGRTEDEIAVFPVPVPPDGGSVRLHLGSRMAPMKRSRAVFKERYSPRLEPPDVSEEEFFQGLRRGNGMVTIRISGKIRSLPVSIWRDR